ncbi:MAG: adenosine kinase [Geminicoccaceae bacterium]|nr:adenosine kinase [Geminicoccaceae bacterium]
MAGSTRAERQVVGLGNAIVDVIAEVDDQLIERLGLDKGAMHLVDLERMRSLYAAMPSGLEMSGGSCANTMAALAALGADVGYVGKVRNDQLGEIFAHDIRATGVAFATPPLEHGPATARCLVFVSPDAQRTMATYLGACVELGPDDVDGALIASAEITYLEGYLWDRPDAKAACLKAAAIAHQNGRQIALTLSDPFCVERWHGEFVDLVEDHVDILIGNEAEVIRLFEVATFEQAVDAARARGWTAALTRGARGSVVVRDGEAVPVAAAAVERVLDTTGAGDLYAAGLLMGLSEGWPLDRAGRLGSLTAGAILGQYGARAEHPLRPLVDQSA